MRSSVLMKVKPRQNMDLYILPFSATIILNFFSLFYLLYARFVSPPPPPPPPHPLFLPTHLHPPLPLPTYLHPPQVILGTSRTLDPTHYPFVWQ